MNKGIVRYVLGRMLLVEAGLMTVPLVVGLFYQESLKSVGSFIIVIALLMITGLATGIKEPKNTRLFSQGRLSHCGFVMVSFVVFRGFLCVQRRDSVACGRLFETSSGFTTTGASILTNVEAMCHSMLFWRSFTHLIGGMGVLVFALALLPNTNPRSVNIMKAEVPGPVFGKLVSKLRDTARILYIIYLAMTATLIILLMFGGWIGLTLCMLWRGRYRRIWH